MVGMLPDFDDVDYVGDDDDDDNAEKLMLTKNKKKSTKINCF